jgi:hypothetical protein
VKDGHLSGAGDKNNVAGRVAVHSLGRESLSGKCIYVFIRDGKETGKAVLMKQLQHSS